MGKEPLLEFMEAKIATLVNVTYWLTEIFRMNVWLMEHNFINLEQTDMNIFMHQDGEKIF